MGAILKELRETHLLGKATREWLVSYGRESARGLAYSCIAGFTEARAGYRFVRHHPPFSMILVGEEGLGRVWLDGQWRECPAGHAYITAPHAAHAYHIAPGHRWRLHWIVYGEAVDPLKLAVGQAPQLVPVDATGLRHAIEGLCHEHAGRRDTGVTATWVTLVDRLAARIVAAKHRDPRLERLWSTVRQDIGGGWDLQRMAHVAGMGEENLRRLCRREVRCSPGAHLTALRMQVAAEALLHTGEKIQSIATRMGYGDPFAFSTAFKRVLGHSPLHHRNGQERPSGAKATA